MKPGMSSVLSTSYEFCYKFCRLCGCVLVCQFLCQWVYQGVGVGVEEARESVLGCGCERAQPATPPCAAHLQKNAM